MLGRMFDETNAWNKSETTLDFIIWSKCPRAANVLIVFPSKQFQLYSNTRIGNWAEKDKGFGCALSHWILQPVRCCETVIVLPGCDADFGPCCFVSEALAGLFLTYVSEIMVFLFSGSSFHNSFAGSFTCCVVDFGSCCFVCEEASGGLFLTRVSEIMVFFLWIEVS